MKKDLFIPLVVLLGLTLGCSKISELANKAANSGPAANSNSESARKGETAQPSGDHVPSSDAKADIERLSDRFMSVKSFRATMKAEGETPMQTELEFVSPDRYRIKTGSLMDVIIIGKTTYMKIGDKWQKMPGELDSKISDLRSTFNKEGMKWVSDVKYTGDDTVDGKAAYVYIYHAKGPDKVGENESKLWIAKADGLPIKVEAVYKSGPMKSMRVEYDYETPVSIEPPIN
jgi:outer membrane lipoprotein-sorting protein